MIRPLLALLTLCLTCAFAQGQSFARQNPAADYIIEDATADQVVAAQAIYSLRRLNDEVFVYQSLGDFEESGKLARVSFQIFQRDLNEVGVEVVDLISRLPDGPVKTELRNALDSYCDGAYWWKKIYQPRVVNVSEFRRPHVDATSSQLFFLESLPYTVAIHWRQANEHLQRAVRAARL
jgi:hypothetical protein